MNMIVAVDNNWAIGKHNELLVSIPADMKFFRQETDGKVVVMGRKTLESFPNGMPACKPGEYCINRESGLSGEGSKDSTFPCGAAEGIEEYRSEDVYVIGVESVYRQLLPYCDVVHATRMIWNIRQTRTSRIWRRIRSGW